MRDRQKFYLDIKDIKDYTKRVVASSPHNTKRLHLKLQLIALVLSQLYIHQFSKILERFILKDELEQH